MHRVDQRVTVQGQHHKVQVLKYSGEETTQPPGEEVKTARQEVVPESAHHQARTDTERPVQGCAALPTSVHTVCLKTRTARGTREKERE